MPDKAKVDKGWQNLVFARAFIRKAHKYFYPSVLALIPRAIEGTGTLRVGRDFVMRIDFEWFGTETPEIGAGCILNTVMHALRNTAARIDALHLPEEEIDRARYAFEIPINDDLKRFNIKLPEWAVYSSTHKLPEGLSGENYYELICRNNIIPPKQKRVAAGGGGGITGGMFIEEEQDKAHGKTPREINYARKMGIEHLRQGLAQYAGTLGGSFKELLEFTGKEETVVPWQQVAGAALGNSLSRAKQGHTDYSLRRPSKRSYAMGLLRPGMVTYEPVVYFIEDSSLSMHASMIKANRVEMCHAMRQLGLTEVFFLDADAEVHGRPRKIGLEDLKSLPVLGRGGTDFRPAIELVMRERPPPDLILYSTDGFGTAPFRKPPGTEFIWLFAPGPYMRSPCDWGIQILTTNDQDERKQFALLSEEQKGRVEQHSF
jgi:predicted metal-dependent peptidase